MSNANSQRLRVLHVVGGLDRAGVETWLRRLSPLLREVGVDCDFVVHEHREYAYADDLRSNGAAVLVCPRPQQRLRYALRFYRMLRTQQPYDVVHGHVQGFNTVVLGVARLAGVRKRIFHSHTTHDLRGQGALTAAKRRIVSWLAAAVSSDLAAVSATAADSAFGSRGATAVKLMPGVDFEPFLRVSRERKALVGAPPVILHIGRFETVKNHAFILDIAAMAKQSQAPWRFVLVGAGSLREQVRARVRTEGLDNVSVVEPRDDLLGLFAEADVFLLPSLYEGLGLVALEAQASGVHTLISGGVPSEAMLEGASVRQIDSFVATEWISAIETSLVAGRTDGEALRRGAEASDISLGHSMGVLLSLYDWNPEEIDESTFR